MLVQFRFVYDVAVDPKNKRLMWYTDIKNHKKSSSVKQMIGEEFDLIFDFSKGFSLYFFDFMKFSRKWVGCLAKVS